MGASRTRMMRRLRLETCRLEIAELMVEAAWASVGVCSGWRWGGCAGAGAGVGVGVGGEEGVLRAAGEERMGSAVGVRAGIGVRATDARGGWVGAGGAGLGCADAVAVAGAGEKRLVRPSTNAKRLLCARRARSRP